MNTLLGEIAKLDDVVYPRYRLAFKMRKLQHTFMLDRVDIPMVTEALHTAGVESLAVSDIVSPSRLSSVMGELYESLRRRTQAKHTTVQLQEAHTTCLNWVMTAFECVNNVLTAGALKIFFCLFCGSKLSEKAKYLFGILAATGDGGNVGRDELQFFFDAVEMMATCLHEVIYSSHQTANRAISECLYFLREEEDIEDEEDYGGLQRPWVSLFEFTKVFCASPALNFFSWIELWYALSDMEKVVHPVKCTVCGTKTMTGYRYHCTECHFSMCEMCFLKGRVAEPHRIDHKVLECMDYSKSFKSRFSLSKTNCYSKEFRVMDEPCSTRDAEYPDGSMTSLASSNSSKLTEQLYTPETPEHHLPTIIRIGSANSSKHGRDSLKRNSITSDASTDSLGSSYIERANSPAICETGQRKAAPIIPSIRRRAFSAGRFSMRCRGQSGYVGVRDSTSPNHLENILLHRVSSDSRMPSKDYVDHEFAEINKQLNSDVDMMMKDLLPELYDKPADSLNLSLNLKADNEASLHQREKVTGEVDVLLEQIQNMHQGFISMKNAGRKPRTHTRYNSLGVSPLHSSTSQKDIVHTRCPSGPSLHTAMVF